MPTPTISGLQVTFPANSGFVVKATRNNSVRHAINPQTVTLDACASGSETTRIYWKQGVVSDAFANLPPLSFVGRTAISGATVIKDVQGGGTPTAVPAGNVKTHIRGKVFTDLVVSNPLMQADVTYSYKRERYDLLELDSATGVVSVVKGTENDFYAPSTRPAPTVGKLPLFWVYVWNDTLELIPAHTWEGTAPAAGSLAAAILASHKARNAAILASVKTKLTSGQNVIVQAYGDSITAQGGGWTASGDATDTTYMATTHGGDIRDSADYFEYKTTQNDAIWGPYPTGWTDANDDGTAAHQTRGWAYQLGKQMDTQYAGTITLQNWGIGATNSGSGTSGAGAPCGNNVARLPSIAAATADVIIINFGMNDFVGFATGGLRAQLKAIVTALQAAQPSRKVVLMGAPGLAAENANTNAGAYSWWYQHHATYLSVAIEMGCAYIPMEMIFHGGPGFVGISTQHYGGVNRYNHPGPVELSKMTDFVRASLGF